jgi:hypothetical protein
MRRFARFFAQCTFVHNCIIMSRETDVKRNRWQEEGEGRAYLRTFIKVSSPPASPPTHRSTRSTRHPSTFSPFPHKLSAQPPPYLSQTSAPHIVALVVMTVFTPRALNNSIFSSVVVFVTTVLQSMRSGMYLRMNRKLPAIRSESAKYLPYFGFCSNPLRNSDSLHSNASSRWKNCPNHSRACNRLSPSRLAVKCA